MTDPADRDPVLMAVADGVMDASVARAGIIVRNWRDWPSERELRDGIYAALLSERHRAEEAMRERARNRLLELKRVRPDGAAWLLLAANAVNDLPLTPEPTHER